MSTSSQAANIDPSSPKFASIFDAALAEYKTLTRQDLHAHPFAAAFDTCDSPDAVLNIFRKQALVFDSFRKGDDKLMKWLTPTINILFALSGTLGEGIGLV
jgi:hypothetical protein